ncbi:protein SAR DEFICIENT 1-like [Mercurialis annua]|uniref:protein SAR DEFICIENT 1-like n=1 Tax=Mercurialis annua TaxID=3986 RepID=UPI00216008CA|nr:protein SAR DEFICIENT 1-like [Mercurialis annua]
MSLHMAAKRFLDEPGSDPTDHKRPRTRPSFASVISEALMVNSAQNFCSILEPMLRRVVNEEMESSLNRLRARSFTRSPSLRIQAPEPSPSRLQLIFKEKLMLPIFTGSKIVDVNGNSLQIQLVDTTEDGAKIPTSLTHPVKVEVVVLDGDFPSDDRATWTSEEFDNKIVKERTGKRPLLAGDCLTVTLRDGIAGIGDVEFTDNSSWIRGRKFRVGARVVLGSSQGVIIREAMSDAFVVKDHRGELYKKHYPPMLNDEVWRLEKIGKDGAFHKKLSAANIKNVQDFLKLSIVDKAKLRTILGNGMSEKMWEVTIKHARTCEMGNKHYVFQGHNCTVTLNPICQMISAIIGGQTYTTQDLPTINRSYIENLVRQAYAKWSSLQEIIAVSSDIPLLKQGENLVDQYSNDHHQAMVKTYQQIDYSSERYCEMGDDHINNTNAHMGYINWHHGSPISPDIRYTISGPSSDGGVLTPRSNYMNGN